MSRAAKVEVLAKCQHLAPESGVQSLFDSKQTTVLRVSDRQVGDRTNDFQIDTWRDGAALSLTISDETPADSYAWALAAQILSIATRENGPSDALLLQAFRIGQLNTPLIGRAKFEKWLALLPCDPVAADRDLIAKYLPYIDLLDATARGKADDCVEEADRLEAAINRLAATPPDLLSADLELLARHLICGSITIDVERTGILSDKSVNIYNTLQRVLGLEVQNG